MSVTKIESDKVTINTPAEKAFEFLSNFNNFGSLMPKEVSNWQASGDECSFTINGMATIGMKIIDKQAPEKITIASTGKVPFDFKLFVNTHKIDDNSCSGQLLFESELNPMLKMMVQKPLTNFFNMLAQQMKNIK